MKRNFAPNPKRIVAVIVAIMFILGIAQVLQGFIDTRDYRAQIEQVVKQQTGRDIIINGKVSVSLLPLPTMYIPNVELRDLKEDAVSPSVTVKNVRLRVDVMSLFSNQPRVSSVLLERPVFNIVRADDNYIHWEWLNTSLLRTLTEKRDSDLSVEIVNGSIFYYNKRDDTGKSVEKINLRAVGGKHLSLRGGLMFYGHEIEVNTTADMAAVSSEGGVPIEISLTSGDNSTAHLQGTMDLEAEDPKLQGKLELDVQDLRQWVPVESLNSAPLPLKLSGGWSQQALDVTISDVKMNGIGSEGEGSLGLTWQDWQPSFSANIHFKRLVYDEWRRLFSSVIEEINRQSTATGYSSDIIPENPLPNGIIISVQAEADQLQMGEQVWKNALLSAQLSDASITINEFSSDLPGKATLVLYGLVSQGATHGLRFEGGMETKGPSLRDMLTVFDPSAADMPEVTFGEFSARSNIFISPEQMRLSEADAKISDLNLTGGLVFYYDARPRMEADVQLKDIDFDYFRDVWREQQKRKEDQDFFLKFDKKLSFEWLKKLQTNIDLKVNVSHFTFLERSGNQASFRIFVKQGEFGVYDMRFHYPTQTTEASFNLNVSGEHPAINVMLNTDRLDTSYFRIAEEGSSKKSALVGKEEPATVDAVPAAVGTTDETKTLQMVPQAEAVQISDDNDGVRPPSEGNEDGMPSAGKDFKMPLGAAWSSDLIDMSWMDGYSGVFDISVGELTHHGIALDRVKLFAKLENSMLTLENFNFFYWGGRCSVLGSLYGGKVPGLSISFTLFSAELYEILNDLVERKNIRGRTSISGTITTSGINYQSWISQLNAKMVLAARGVDVWGVNLQGVVDTVMVSRTAADVFNNANAALIRGNTIFDVDGNINVRGGVVKTPGITLKSGPITGNLTGEIKLVPWKMESSTLFQFPSISSETIPTMTVQLSGPVDAPVLRTDTSSLEAFVAKRIISK